MEAPEWLVKSKRWSLADLQDMLAPEDSMEQESFAPPAVSPLKAPQVMASLNNLALGLLGRLGITNVAEAQRSLDYHIDRALHRLSASQVAP